MTFEFFLWLFDKIYFFQNEICGFFHMTLMKFASFSLTVWLKLTFFAQVIPKICIFIQGTFDKIIDFFNDAHQHNYYFLQFLDLFTILLTMLYPFKRQNTGKLADMDIIMDIESTSDISIQSRHLSAGGTFINRIINKLNTAFEVTY